MGRHYSSTPSTSMQYAYRLAVQVSTLITDTPGQKDAPQFLQQKFLDSQDG